MLSMTFDYYPLYFKFNLFDLFTEVYHNCILYTPESKVNPKALKRDSIYNIDMLFLKKGFRRLFTFTIKALTYTYVPVGLAHSTHSASIV